jgi:phage terminase large subunit
MQAPETIRTVEQWNNRNYTDIYAWRQMMVNAIRASPELRAGALAYYAKNKVDFINHWCDTVDPRNAGRPGMLVRMPFQLFQRQEDLLLFADECVRVQQNGLVEKVRTAGATWTYCAWSVHQWRFAPGAAIGWGSRKEQLVDKIGDMDSIFEKIRSLIRGLPEFFWPKGFNPESDKHMSYMRIVNPENGATITGEAGDNIGRGGRKTIYFKDESAHYERPAKIEASLSENTRVQMDISSVNGTGNPFHNKRENGVEWQPEAVIEPDKTRVFIFDVFDHPGNTRAWYEARKKKFKDDGLPHVFAQEIDRNYSASVEGIIIPQEYVNACIDAHLFLRILDGVVFYDPTASIGQPYFDDSGPWTGSLDVADGGGDKNAFTARKGVVLRRADEWGAPDTGASTRRAVGMCDGLGDMNIQYDAIGVGSGVKAEANRLAADNHLRKGLTFVPWIASAKLYKPFDPVVPSRNRNHSLRRAEDKTATKNIDFFANYKAQAWWNVRMRAHKVWQMVAGLQGLIEDVPIEQTPIYDPEELMSIDSKIPFLQSIKKELSQAVAVKSSNLKTMVDKTPENTKSPNLGDSIVMNYFPAVANAAKAAFGTTSTTR